MRGEKAGVCGWTGKEAGAGLRAVPRIGIRIRGPGLGAGLQGGAVNGFAGGAVRRASEL